MAVVHQLDSVDIAEVMMDEEELCGFCFQGYVGMEDPRQMPCGHVYCLGCLEVHTENIEGVDCAYSYCSGFCLHKKVPALPMVVVIDTPEPQPVTTSVCECRGCGNQIATNFCVDCGKKLCSFHNEHHPAFFDEHHVVPITTYEDTPQDFKKPLCEEHNKPLQLACEVCHKLVCVECDLMAKTCEGGKAHTMKGMEAFEAKLNKRYTELLNKAPVEVAKLCKLEKELWTKHDDVLSHNEMMIRDVDKQTEKQIKAIQREAEKIKNSIMREQQSMTAKVIEDTTDLMGKREKIDLLQRSMCQLRDRGHVTEKIRWMQKSTLDMEELSITNLVHTIPSIVTAPISTGKLSQLEMQLAQLPSELQFKKQCVNDFLSRSAICVKGEDDIVIIFDNTEITLGPQLKVKAKHSLPDKYSQPDNKSRVVLAQSDGVLFKLEAGILSTCTNARSSMSLHASSDLLSIFKNIVVSAKRGDTCIYLSFDKYAYQSTAQDKTKSPFEKQQAEIMFKVSMLNQRLKDFGMPSRNDSSSQTLDNLEIHNIVLQNDETLLAVGQDEQKIAKLSRYFVIEGKRVELDWSCDLPDLCQALTVGEHGEIYTSSVHGRKVYIVSPQGYILKEIMNDNLPMDISYMAVRGKELVVAGGTSLQLYQILGC